MPEPPQDAWIVLIQDVLVPVDVRSVLEALKPAVPFGAPVFIRPDTSSWTKAAEYQRNLIAEILAKSRHALPPRFATFCIAPIPLIVQLGFLLSDSVLVHYYKYHIDTQSWQWPDVDSQDVDLDIHVSGLPQKPIQQACDALIRISLSARVRQHETDEVAAGLPVQIDIFVNKPSLLWIRSLNQLDRIGSIFRNVLAEIRTKVPYCQNIHLFYAGPAPGAVIIGQQINPRMNPPVHVYEYSRQKSPRYEQALILKREKG